MTHNTTIERETLNPPAQLSKAERDTLNKAMEIIERSTAQGSSWQMSAARYAAKSTFDVMYFDSTRGPGRFHGEILGDTFADKVQNILDIEVSVSAPLLIREATQ